MNTLPPIRRAILVEADPAAAFEVFTAAWAGGGRSVSSACTARTPRWPSTGRNPGRRS